MSGELAGIPAPTLSQQVAQLEWQRDQLNHIAGELIATCLVNLDRGNIVVPDEEFRRFVEARASLRAQVIGEGAAFQQRPDARTP